MGRDRMRVVVGAVVAIALIVTGALLVDWYRLSFEPSTGGALRIAVDLRAVYQCHVDQACTAAPLTPLPGMFPVLAAVTMWSSLGVAAIVAFQAGRRILTGRASDLVTKVGYAVSLMAISIAIATAYMFGPHNDGSMIGAAAHAGVLLHRAWGPVTLVAGLVAGFATLYMTVAHGPSSRVTERVVVDPERPSTTTRTRTPVVRIPFPEQTGLFPFSDNAAIGTATGPRPLPERVAAGSTPIPLRQRPPSLPPDDDLRDQSTLALRQQAATELRSRTRTVAGIAPVRAAGSQQIGVRPPLAPEPPPLRERAATGVHAIPAIARSAELAAPAGVTRQAAGPQQPTASEALADTTPTILAVARPKTTTIPVAPPHLRNRLSYVAITADLTSGGIDARREDGSSRLVLWRDVVGVVARRLPPVYDGTLFVDIVSSAGSTLRILPWTRLTGELIVTEPDERPRGVIERVASKCPAAKLDPATRQFLATGDAAQLPDIETLRAHDARLA